MHLCSACHRGLVGYPLLPAGFTGCPECDLLHLWPRLFPQTKLYDQDAPE